MKSQLSFLKIICEYGPRGRIHKAFLANSEHSKLLAMQTFKGSRFSMLYYAVNHYFYIKTEITVTFLCQSSHKTNVLFHKTFKTFRSISHKKIKWLRIC